MRDIIKEAIQEADRKEHGGAGYRLRILTSSGYAFEADVFGTHGGYRLQVKDSVNPIIINPTQVVTVEVVF